MTAQRMDKHAKVYVAGHTGLIGSAVVRRLRAAGYEHLVTAPHAELELTDAGATQRFFAQHKPQFVVLAAGRVGGIVQNREHPADFIRDNLAIQLNVLNAAHAHGVERLVMFGSSCMYPRECAQPMAEEQLLTGKPEPTSIAYAIAKLAGVQLCLALNAQYGVQRFLPLIPNTAYGPNDNFDPASSHVVAALIRRFSEAIISGADRVVLWGSGKPRRELVHADDVAAACVFMLEGSFGELTLPLNIGVGEDWSIAELAEQIAAVAGYKGRIEWDTSKPDGAPRKLLDSSRARALGWSPSINSKDGLRDAYEWYRANTPRGR